MSHDSSNPHKTPKERVREVVTEIANCSATHYCTLKEILCRYQERTREILQIKCIEKFKYERSEAAGREIHWNEAFEMWIEDGRADAFARHYHDGIRFPDLFRQVMGH
jgi:DhnA family fructose-bisphosphate aldolase class Ia